MQGGATIVMAVMVISSYAVSIFMSRAMGMKGKAVSIDQLHEIGNVPYLHEHYVSRGKVEEIIQGWLTQAPADGVHPRVFIEGMAGIGKTALAMFAVKSTVGHFWSGTFWLQAKSSSARTVLSYFEELHKRMSDLFVPSLSVSQKGQATWRLDEFVVSINGMLERRTCLVVLDGVQSPEVVEVMLQLKCTLLITTQVRSMLSNQTQFKHADVAPMDIDNSHKLFLKLVPNGVQQEGVEKVLESCGGHPLALSIVGTLFQDAMTPARVGKEADVGHLVTKLQDPRCRLQMHIKSETILHIPDVEKHSTVMRCFDFSLDALNKHEREMYVLLAALPPRSQATTHQLGAIWHLQDDQALCLAKKLERYCFLQKYVPSDDPNVTSNQWGMHVLQHDYIKVLREAMLHNVQQ
ncbi:unnamed protein product [Ostreobium quekettii]|uniref:NB-ARC domain-containing protein n=1 Tax=Ostreobium quekettii TaxID=121088 RepID=A0A8S1IPE9_9CHLO|nr:unnamed protein product [Ostreobium quekettii]